MVVLPGVSQDNHGCLQPFGLVDGQERNASLGRSLSTAEGSTRSNRRLREFSVQGKSRFTFCSHQHLEPQAGLSRSARRPSPGGSQKRLECTGTGLLLNARFAGSTFPTSPAPGRWREQPLITSKSEAGSLLRGQFERSRPCGGRCACEEPARGVNRGIFGS